MHETRAKLYFWILLDVLLVVWVVCAVFFAMPAVGKWGRSFVPVRTIAVSAEGKTLAAPDIAELSFSVISQGKNPDELSDSNNQKMNAVAKFVKGLEIAEADMKTTSYSLQPNYQYDRTTQRNFITGYTLTQTLTIKVRKLEKVATVIAGLTPLGVNQIGGVNFTIDNPEQYLSQARKDAFRKAEAKAREIAGEAGVVLGGVITASEYQQGPIPYMMASAEKFGLGMGGASAPVAPTIQPGTSEVKLSVNVTYEIR
ncbi:MAG: SIMPL domain-containing protein [Candidatus Liptonbacteria bacterium]|nr:SIMPL domain-containing protein [Candidatus Liptonbacteria bacterium]